MKLLAIFFLFLLAIWEAPNILKALNTTTLQKQQSAERLDLVKALIK